MTLAQQMSHRIGYGVGYRPQMSAFLLGHSHGHFVTHFLMEPNFTAPWKVANMPKFPGALVAWPSSLEVYENHEGGYIYVAVSVPSLRLATWLHSSEVWVRE